MSGLTIGNPNQSPLSSPSTANSEHGTQRKTRKVAKTLLFHYGSSIVSHFKIDSNHECASLQSESDNGLFEWNGKIISAEELISTIRQGNLAIVLRHCALDTNLSSFTFLHLFMLFNRIAAQQIKYNTWELEWKNNFTKIVQRSLEMLADLKPPELKAFVWCCALIEYQDSNVWQAFITEYNARADGEATRVGYRIADFSPHDLALSVSALYLAHWTDRQIIFPKVLQEILRRATFANSGKETPPGTSWSDFSDKDIAIIANTLHNIQNRDPSLCKTLQPFHEDLLQLLKETTAHRLK